MCTCQIEGGLGVTVTGSGVALVPYVISTAVDTAGGSLGDVLQQDADGIYRPGPPATTAPGAILTGVGLVGDGSAGDPLEVRLCSYGQLKGLCA